MPAAVFLLKGGGGAGVFWIYFFWLSPVAVCLPVPVSEGPLLLSQKDLDPGFVVGKTAHGVC